MSRRRCRAAAAVTPGLYQHKQSIPEDESCGKEFFEVRIKKDGTHEAFGTLPYRYREPLKLRQDFHSFEKKDCFPRPDGWRAGSWTCSRRVPSVLRAAAHPLLGDALANWTVFGDLYQAKINLTHPNHALTYDLPAG